MHIIDSHCHLYLPEFKRDLDEVFLRAKQKYVAKYYLPAIDSEVIEDMLALEAKHPELCKPMMGLHPCSVKTATYRKELGIVEEWLGKRPFAAVGEIGLDFYWDTSTTTEQYEAFEMQMQWALDYKLPIVIHSRNATRETIDTVKPYAKKGLKGIFHCFGGTLDEANEITGMGFLLGIGGVITYKKAGLDVVLKDVSLEHIVLETDAPYLTPAPFRGKRNEPAYLEHIVKKLAEVKQVTEEEVAKVTGENAEKIFVHW